MPRWLISIRWQGQLERKVGGCSLHKMHLSLAFMTVRVAVRFLCGLFSASASVFVRSKEITGEREREKEGERKREGKRSIVRVAQFPSTEVESEDLLLLCEQQAYNYVAIDCFYFQDFNLFANLSPNVRKLLLQMHLEKYMHLCKR